MYLAVDVVDSVDDVVGVTCGRLHNGDERDFRWTRREKRTFEQFCCLLLLEQLDPCIHLNPGSDRSKVVGAGGDLGGANLRESRRRVSLIERCGEESVSAASWD